jgi:hypothetical protein
MARVDIKTIKFRKDYLSVDTLTAISSEGEIFEVGDKVKHEGDSLNRVGTIEKFHINSTKNEVEAVTEHGIGSISFLYK